MTRILRDLPFYEDAQLFYLHPPPKFVRILPWQVPIRVSLGVLLPGVKDYVPAQSSFPAILDTGFNGDLAINGFHLKEWAGISTESLGVEVKTRSNQEKRAIQGFAARAFESQFYIRPNRPSTWDASDDRPVEIGGRIHVVDAPPDRLRLHLLGMSALDSLGLKLTIDYRRRLIQL